MLEHNKIYDLQQVQKSLWFGLPTTILILLACYFIAMPEVMQTIKDIRDRSAIVRVAVAGFGLFIMVPMIFFLVPLSLLKAVPVHGKITFIMERLLNINIFIAGAFVVVGMPLLTLAQYYYMPKLGYSKCNELQGHPTMWLNDWVRNPEWCVRGKDRAWVLEQAQRQTEVQGQSPGPRRLR